MSFDSLVRKCISKQYSSQLQKRKKKKKNRLTKINRFKRQCTFLEKKKDYFYKGIGNILYQRNIAARMKKERKKYFIKHFS